MLESQTDRRRDESRRQDQADELHHKRRKVARIQVHDDVTNGACDFEGDANVKGNPDRQRSEFARHTHLPYETDAADDSEEYAAAEIEVAVVDRGFYEKLL